MAVGSLFANKLHKLFAQVSQKSDIEGLPIALTWLMKKIWRKAKYLSVYTLSFPIAIALVLIRPIIKVRLICLFSARIGHYALNTELMLCTFEADKHSCRRQINLFYTQCGADICNRQLHKMWKRVIPITPFPVMAYQIDRLSGLILGDSYGNDEIKKIFEHPIGARDKDGLFKKTKPHLYFTDEEELQGRQLMEQLGVPRDAHIVCLLVRDSKYLNHHLPDSDWSYQNYRDADIENYKKTALFLAEKGYYLLRMGKWVDKAFNVGHPKVIDYANHPLRSDFMDIYLSSQCDFFISTATGLDSVATIFRKPIIFTDLAQLFLLPTFYPIKLFIPKKLVDINSGHYLPLKEMINILLKPDNKDKIIPQVLREEEVKFIGNTPEEILSVVMEMVCQLEGSWQVSEEDRMLQKKFWSQYPSNKCDDINVRIGSAFLRENIKFLN
ncbi:MAG: hypothetical protein A3F11_03250 [Gammaproteobacteria bacterium RIFCSPHIGHO2_12_FULL_37_14]|nr:MAG: hypothetical protein A3F11_03250 [Gammaproteobacteria bacterium RIFCSPHIGHO2_12_FULL_37_14]